MALWQFMLIVVIIVAVNVAAWTMLHRKLKNEFAIRFQSLESADKQHMREQSRVSEEQARLLEQQELLRAQHTGAIASLQRTVSELSRVLDDHSKWIDHLCSRIPGPAQQAADDSTTWKDSTEGIVPEDEAEPEEERNEEQVLGDPRGVGARG